MLINLPRTNADRNVKGTLFVAMVGVLLAMFDVLLAMSGVFLAMSGVLLAMSEVFLACLVNYWREKSKTNNKTARHLNICLRQVELPHEIGPTL